jgi:hypothetical protein
VRERQRGRKREREGEKEKPVVDTCKEGQFNTQFL